MIGMRFLVRYTVPLVADSTSRLRRADVPMALLRDRVDVYSAGHVMWSNRMFSSAWRLRVAFKHSRAPAGNESFVGANTVLGDMNSR